MKAVECASGSKYWYQNGELHRLDGPSIEYADGYKEYWIEGVKYSEEEFKAKTNPDSCDGKVVEINNKKYQLKLLTCQ